MKALFVVTGIGLGHTMREEAIINEFKKNEVIIAGFKNSYNYFKNTYKCYRIFGHKFYGYKPRTSYLRIFFENLMYPIYLLIDTILLCFVILKNKIEVVIVDAEPCGLIAGKLTGRKTIIVYNLDLKKLIEYRRRSRFSFGLLLVEVIARISYWLADKVVVPVLDKNTKNYGNVIYVEPIIRIKPGNLETKKDLMKKLGFKKEPILVTIGGSKFGVPLVNEIIKVAKYFDEEFIVLGLKMGGEKNVRFYGFKKNFLEYLKISKAVVGSFGHSTLSEIFVYDKAGLIFPIKGYVEHYLNLVSLTDYIRVRDFGNVNEYRLKLMINALLKDRENLERRLKRLNIKGNGAREVAKLILE